MKWIVSFLVLCVACGGAVGPDPKTPESIVRKRERPAALVDASTGQSLEVEQFFARIRTSPVIYVAERHDQPADHGAQYAILRELHREERNIAIGMEMFQVPFQEILNDWSRGRLDESNLRRQTEWDQRWGYDFAMYRPILEYARTWQIPIVALNVPRSITKQVATGGVDSLSEEDRASLPPLELNDSAHRAAFEAMFDAEAHGGAEGLDRYYEAQVVWDDVMAARVADTLRSADAPSRMVVLAGRGHVQSGVGIPKRAAAQGAEPYVVVMPVTEEELKAQLKLPPNERAADFFWGVNG